MLKEYCKIIYEYEQGIVIGKEAKNIKEQD
jgi:hypothetical protein